MPFACIFETRSNEAQAGFKFGIFLLQPPFYKDWNHPKCHVVGFYSFFLSLEKLELLFNLLNVRKI